MNANDFSLVTIRDCAREDAISCKDSQLVTPSVSAVRHVTALTDWRLRSKNKPRRDAVGCGRPQPTTPLSANPTGGSCSAARCYHPASVGVAIGDMVAEQRPLAAAVVF